ncbi:MAG: alpha/beta hydrolase [Sphingomonadaceae bacterium]|nr:alpha/beta hydrolase [Sphingomonadaceae bacterium]
MIRSTYLAAAALVAAAVSSPGQAQEALVAPGPQGELSGTLIRPADGGPVVLVIPGSGPTDRDGNNPLGVKAAPYRLLAEALGTRGIGSVRIDKRGMFGSKGAVPDPNQVTIGDYGDDVAAWVAAARAATGNACVWLLGHSEGGLVALAAAQRVPDLCGVILVASGGQTFGDILRAQLRANPANAPILADALGAIDRLERGERVDVSAMHPALQDLFAPAVQGFLIDAMAYDPSALAAQVTLPMLIVQGGKDLQVPLANGEALHAAQPAAQYVLVPDMNHVLKDVAGDAPQANLAAYSDPSLPVAPGLVEAIAGFVADPGAGDPAREEAE